MPTEVWLPSKRRFLYTNPGCPKVTAELVLETTVFLDNTGRRVFRLLFESGTRWFVVFPDQHNPDLGAMEVAQFKLQGFVPHEPDYSTHDLP